MPAAVNELDENGEPVMVESWGGLKPSIIGQEEENAADEPDAVVNIPGRGIRRKIFKRSNFLTSVD